MVRHIRFVKIPIDDIKHFKIIDYDTFSRFGGWGTRYNLDGERADNIGGGKGIQLDTRSKVVIGGSRSPAELESAMKTMYQRLT